MLVVSVLAAAALLGCAIAAQPESLAGRSAARSTTETVAADLPRDIGWRPCDDPTLAQYRMECASIAVPLDYRHPAGQRIAIALSRIVHTVPDAQYQGVMLVNPGGPGASGLVDAVVGEFVPHGAGLAYDWIGFDPRGVGASSPQLSCDPSYFAGLRPSYAPSTAALEATWLTRSKAFAGACGRDQAVLLPHMTTADSARDLDSIRRALGVDQINFYGFSYGTYLAQVYATLFPPRIRRMVLDSNVDPRRTWYQANLDQDVAFDRDIKIWFGWLARYDSVYHLGTTAAAVQRLFYREQDQLGQHPAGAVGPDEWNDLFLDAAYYRVTWLDLAAAFSDWVHNGDTSGLITEYENSDMPGNDNTFAVYNAVECVDQAWPTSWAQWRSDGARTYQVAPFFTWGNVWYNAPCLFWPARPSTPVAIDGHQAPPTLLIDETLDAATPFPGSLEVRRRLPRASLIAEPGGISHADTLTGDSCVDDRIAAYLADGTLPPRLPGDGPDLLCAPLPEPDPTLPPLATTAIAGIRPALARTDTLLNFLAHH